MGAPKIYNINYDNKKIELELNRKYQGEKLKFFEYDSNSEAWNNIYFNIYNFLSFNEPKYSSGKMNRITFCSNIKGNEIEVGGDIVFNFNYIKGRATEPVYNKYTDNSLQLITALEYFQNYMHSPWNLSLMPIKGNLNGIKGLNLNDRLDSFLFELNNFYKNNKEETSLIKNESLIDMLKIFDDIYDYCSFFYPTLEREFIDTLIRSGQAPINTARRLEEYIRYAEFYMFSISNALKSSPVH